MKYKNFKPKWKTDIADRKSYRGVYRWGNPYYYREPNEQLYVYIKEKLGLTDEDFILTREYGEEFVDIELGQKLSKNNLAELESLVGKINIATDIHSRIASSYGKSSYDSLRVRHRIIENVADAVVSPSSEEQVESILQYCNKNKIAIYPCGGKTNTSRATECINGGVSLDMRKNFNKVLEINEVNKTVTVMAGITGAELEQVLNNANTYLANIQGKYTVGFVPQSFEYATVGGWIASRGRGQLSAYYGGIDDILVSARYITPKGIIDTAKCNRRSGIPCIDELMLGSNGSYGVILSATLKIRKYTPDTKHSFGYQFSDWDTATRCVREIVQKENGNPSIMRICDEDSSELLMRMCRIINKGIFGSFLRRLGNDMSRRCLLIGSTAGEKSYSRMVRRSIARTSARYGGNNITSYATDKWEKNQFSEAYLRDILADFDIVFDQFDCVVNWSDLSEVYSQVKSYFKDKNILNMTNFSHITSQGGCYSISYLGKFSSIDSYKDFHEKTLAMLKKTNAKMVKNHAIGKMYAESLNDLTSAHFGVIKAVKKFLDPKNVMNPGGTMNFDD